MHISMKIFLAKLFPTQTQLMINNEVYDNFMYLCYTVYMVHLMVILIWQSGKFVFICQIKYMHCLQSYVSYVIWITPLPN